MNIKTSCSYYNKTQQSQRQHKSHSYNACRHLTEMLKILRADSPQLFVKRLEIKFLQSVVWTLNERENYA